MRTKSSRMIVGAGLGVAVLAAAGCLERKETIKVARDGAVTIELEYSGKPEVFETTDALPSEAAGWAVRRTVERKPGNGQALTPNPSPGGRGEEEVTLTARRRFEPREELPSSFAATGDADAKLYVQFPTEVRVDRRPDGVYLHFRRTYLPRPWAYVEYWSNQLVSDDVKKLGEKPVEELSAEEKRKLVEASAGIEFYKQMELAKAALREIDPNLPQDYWLRARGAMMQLAEKTDWDALIQRLLSVPEEARGAAFEEESKRLLDATYATLVRELSAAAGWGEDEVGGFEAAYAREQKRYDITNEVGSHGFKIRVEMPGEIVAHNGDSAEDGGVNWEFSGEAFRDRPYELMVTSRIGKGGSN